VDKAAKYQLHFASSVSDKLIDENITREYIEELVKRTQAPQANLKPTEESAALRARRKIERLTNFEAPTDIHKTANVCNVMIVSPEDGREAIVKFTKALSQYITTTSSGEDFNKNLKEDDSIISNKLIHEFLSSTHLGNLLLLSKRLEIILLGHDGRLWTLPDFLVSFEQTSTTTLGDFPPWLLRYAEI